MSKTDAISISLVIWEQQLVKVVDKLVEVAASTWCRGLRLPGVD
jgi:hypothetical protein